MRLLALMATILATGCHSSTAAQKPAHSLSEKAPLVASESPNKRVEDPKDTQEPSLVHGYYIDEVEVTKEVFDARLSKMTSINGTWFCDEEEGGGTTGEDFRDAEGKTYHFLDETNLTTNRTSLVQIRPAPAI